MSNDIYAAITNRIIEQLEQGVIPWRSPYLGKVGFPKNFVSGKQYRGINVFLLASLKYTSPFFLTFKQVQDLGGRVKKGARGGLVIKYGTYVDELEGDERETLSERRRAYLKGYTVFNAAQIDGITFPEVDGLPDPEPNQACGPARAIVDAMPNPPMIEHGTAIAFYRPESDCVSMPERRFFVSEPAYYATLFHELVHATGHVARLSRKSLLENKGIEAGGEARRVYAEEELVAEMGACFLCANAGIAEPDLANAAAYIQGWITALKAETAKAWIVRAAAQAQKAADFVLGLAPEKGLPCLKKCEMF